MPRVLGLFPSALIAARAGLSANEFIRDMQALGMGARRADILKMYGEAKDVVRRSGAEVFRDITQTPTASEITPWSTRKATGFVQTVRLVYRDSVTGTYHSTYWKTSNPQPMQRERAIAMAINAYEGSASGDNQELDIALHTSTYEQIPWSAAA